MSESQLMLTIRFTKFRPLGSADYPTYKLYQTLSEILRQRLGDEVAAFLALPVHDRSRNAIDFFAEVDGPVVPLVELNERQQDELLNKVGGLAERIYGLAAKIRVSDTPEAEQLATALEQVICIPEKDAIFLVGDQPIITSWGFVRESDGGCIDTRMLVEPPDQPKSLYETERDIDPVKPWLWWWILTGLLMLLALLALWLWYSKTPPVPETESLQPSQEDVAAIEEKLKRHGAGTGEIMISLSWNTTDDIDLELLCPNGTVIEHDGGGCGGWLQDVDVINEPDAIENIRLVNRSSALKGEYRVMVSLHTLRNTESVPIPFKVQLVRGEILQHFDNNLDSEGQRRDIVKFTLE